MEQNPFLAPLRLLTLPWREKARIFLIVCFVIPVMFYVPTGWLYDLWAGTGTGQGQTPDSTVPVIRTHAEMTELFFHDAPATVAKEGLIPCPLLRLRDTEYAGEHTTVRNRVRKTIEISEYVPIEESAGPIRRVFLALCAPGIYNRYYLAPLEDGSYICVYFDDYLMLRPGEELHTGHVRDTTLEEQTMLQQMEEQYDVDPIYVLDMYRHGKVMWGVDFLIRAVAAILGSIALSEAVTRGIRQFDKRREERSV